MAFSRDLMLGMLRRGSNGAEINQILELIATEMSPVSAAPATDTDEVVEDTVVFDTVDESDVVNATDDVEVELALA